MPINERVAADLPVTIKTSSYTLLPGDWGREIQFQGTSLIATLPTVADAGNGYNVIIRKIGGDNLSIAGNGADVEGNSTLSLSADASVWLRCDGTEWKAVAGVGSGGGSSSSGGLQSIQAFPTSGSYDVATAKSNGVNRIKVTVVGGGGGGGNCNASVSEGDVTAGGGSGGMSTTLITFDENTPDSISYTVGAGGGGGTSAGDPGQNGETSSFGSNTCSATGGTGGAGAALNTGTGDPGQGGEGTYGNLNLNGNSGQPGSNTNTHQKYGGAGAASILGGAPLPTINETSTSQAGADGDTYGAGGSGGFQAGGSGDSDGGDGADGVVIVEEYA